MPPQLLGLDKRGQAPLPDLFFPALFFLTVHLENPVIL